MQHMPIKINTIITQAGRHVAALMLTVVANLTDQDVVALSAYVASLNP